MSFRLVEEVLAAMPTDATASERLLAVVIAHRADEKSRQCWPGMDQLRDDTGMHPETIRRSLSRLATLGLDLRAPGVVAHKGRRAVYRVPVLQSPNGSQGLTDQSPCRSSAKPLPIVGQSPNGWQGPEGNEPTEPARAREDHAMRNDKPEPLDDAAALWSDTHPGRELDALAAALALMAKDGVVVEHPAAFFATWSPERRAAVKLPKSTEPFHTLPYCGHCDGPTTRRLEDDRGNLLRGAGGSVVRCDCWSPRTAVAS